MKCSPFPPFNGPMGKTVIPQQLICLISPHPCVHYILQSSQVSWPLPILIIVTVLFLSFHLVLLNFFILISPFFRGGDVFTVSFVLLLVLLCFVFLPFFRYPCSVYWYSSTCSKTLFIQIKEESWTRVVVIHFWASLEGLEAHHVVKSMVQSLQFC